MTDPTAALDAIEAELDEVETATDVADVIHWAIGPARRHQRALLAVARAAAHLVAVDGDWVEWGAHVDGLQAALASLTETGEVPDDQRGDNMTINAETLECRGGHHDDCGGTAYVSTSDSDAALPVPCSCSHHAVPEPAARYIVRKAPGIEGRPIPEDEPCIVVRGQDFLALEVMDCYLHLYSRLPSPDQRVLDELMAHRERIVDWQAQHPPKQADR